jgi:hypothetical protein
MLNAPFHIGVRKLVCGGCLALAGALAATSSAQSDALSMASAFEELAAENAERELQALASAGGAGLCLVALLLFVRRQGSRMRSDTFFHRLAGLPQPPDVPPPASARGSNQLPAETAADSMLQIEAGVDPGSPAEVDLAAWAGRSGHWRAKADVRIEMLADLDSASEEYAALVKQVRRELQPAPGMAPAELLERAQFAGRARQLLPDEPWPLVFELAARFWAGDRSNAQRLLAEIKSEHVGSSCDTVLLAAVARCFLEAKRWKEALQLYRRLKSNSAYAAEAEAVIALLQTPQPAEVRNPLNPEWKAGLDELVQRHAALSASN